MMKKTDRNKTSRLMCETIQFIQDNGITEYCDLMEHLMDGGDSMSGMFDVAMRNPMFFDEYLVSLKRISNRQTTR